MQYIGSLLRFRYSVECLFDKLRRQIHLICYRLFKIIFRESDYIFVPFIKLSHRGCASFITSRRTRSTKGGVCLRLQAFRSCGIPLTVFRYSSVLKVGFLSRLFHDFVPFCQLKRPVQQDDPWDYLMIGISITASRATGAVKLIARMYIIWGSANQFKLQGIIINRFKSFNFIFNTFERSSFGALASLSWNALIPTNFHRQSTNHSIESQGGPIAWFRNEVLCLEFSPFALRLLSKDILKLDPLLQQKGECQFISRVLRHLRAKRGSSL